MKHDYHLECSICGSSDYETFQNKRYSGIRCLNCGHDKITTPQPSIYPDVPLPRSIPHFTYWSSNHTKPNVF